MANGIDFGTAIGLIKGIGSPDPAVIESAVNGWLDDHPEATTTVQDGSITKAKLDSNLQGTVDDVADLKSEMTECQEELGLGGEIEYAIPSGYKTANYSNTSGLRQFKYADEKVFIRIAQTSSGTISASEVTTSNASLTIGDTLGVSLAAEDSLFLKFFSVNTFDESAGCNLILRYYNDGYSSLKAVNYVLPNNQTVEIDVVALAEANNISIADYPNLIIRGVGYVSHIATGAEEASVDIYGYYHPSTAVKLSDQVAANTQQIATNTADIEDLKNRPSTSVDSSSVAGNVFQFSPYYAHLFINTVSDNAADTYVPSQSLYDIETAKRLGFKVIEVNTHILTDGTSLCMHGTSNKFGLEFVAAQGSSYTDAQVQDTNIADVSMDWVRANVRYKAKYGKTQLTPLTLEEFLLGCRANNMIPLINYKNIGQIAIADSIMGKDNYIMYGAGKSVRNISGCVIATFSNLTTKQEIYDWVDGIGNPCIVGVTHYDNFSLSDWKDIVENVHAKGGLMAFGYMTPDQEQNLFDIGFDCGASAYSLNPCNSGNMANLCADNGFDDFTITDGIETNAQVTMEANGTITPDIMLDAEFLTGMWLDITFTGSISVSMGRFITHSGSTMSANTPRTVHLSTYALNLSPTFEIKALSAGTVIQNIVFKASKL